MPTLSITPNPAAPGTQASVSGAGFNNRPIRLLLDGSGYTKNTFRARKDGTFAVGLILSSTPKSQVLLAQQEFPTGVWSDVARIDGIVVQNPPTTAPLAFSSSIGNAATLTGTVPWLATVIAGTPLYFDFLIDNMLQWHEVVAPFGGDLDTTVLANGPHEFKVIGVDTIGPAPTRVTATVNNVITPPPPSNSMYLPIYGPGLECDSKDNWQVGWGSSQKVSFRFRARGGQVTHLAVNERGGQGYSGGNGASIKAAFQLDVNGKPSGTDLGSVTFTTPNPGGDWERKNRHAFQTPVTLTAGTLYHIVFTNPSASQTTNYISLNVMTVLSGQSAHQPAYSADFDVLNNRGSWASVHETPVFDLTYADGGHDGNGYYQITVTTPGQGNPTQSIVSGNQQIRQRFTPLKDITVKSMAIRIKRLGGTSPLTLSIDGITSASVSTASVPISTEPTPAGGNHWDGASLGGGRWVKATFAPVTLKAGTTYSFRVTSPSDSRYMAIPLRAVGDEASPAWGSRVFSDGPAERTTNGTLWSEVYPDGRHDWQFYFDLA